MRIRFFIFLLLLFFSLPFLHAQQIVRFGQLDGMNGLSHGRVLAVFQDSRGFMWFGTENGLNKYDGYKFTTYNFEIANEHSLSDGQIFCIDEDKSGNLWIGTFGGGVNKFNVRENKFYRNPAAHHSVSPVAKSEIQSLYCDYQGNIWIGTFQKGLYCYHTKDSTYTHIAIPNASNSAGNSILSIVSDSKSRVWIGTDLGLCQLNVKTNEVVSYFAENVPNSLKYKRIDKIVEDKTGLLWLGSTYIGHGFFNPENQQYSSYLENDSIFSNDIMSIAFDENNDMWCGFYNKGIYKLKINTQNTSPKIEKVDAYLADFNQPFALKSLQCFKLLFDKSGILWSGTNGNAIQYKLPDYKKITYYHRMQYSPESLPFESIRAILKTDSILWLGGYGGLIKKNLHTGKSNQNIYSLCQDAENPHILWIGTQGTGFSKFDIQKETFQHFLNQRIDGMFLTNIYYIHDDRKNHLWLCSNFGIFYFDKTTSEIKKFSIPKFDLNSANIQSVAEDTDGSLWFCSQKNGLIHYSPATQKSEIWTTANGLSSNIVYSAFISDSLIWLGTSVGVNVLNKHTRKIRFYTTQHGLGSNSVYGVLADNTGSIWLSTSKGISRFNPQNENFKNYTPYDGLLGSEMHSGSCFKDSDGQLFFGGIDGVNAFFPQNMIDNPYKTSIFITSFKKYNTEFEFSKHINFVDTIELSYNDKIVSIEFAYLNYIGSQQNTYSYRIKGYTNKWMDIGTKNEITINIPPAGKYILQIHAANNDGVWADTIKEIVIIIHPPFWKTLWFRGTLLLAVVVLAFVAIRLRIAHLKRERRILEEKITLRTHQIQQQNEQLMIQKEHILQQQEEILAQADNLKEKNIKLMKLNEFKENMVGMLVHDLKNPLNRIINISDSHTENEKIEIAKRTAKEMHTLVMNLLDVQKYEETKMKLNTHNCNLRDTANEAILNVRFLAQNQHIEIECNIDTQTTVISDTEVLVRVFTNLLTNAIKYSPPSSKVLINSEIIGNFAKILVTDTGEGIAKDKIPLIFERFGQINERKSGTIKSTGLGLTFCKLAVEAHGGEIGVESTPTVGSTFWFTIPLSSINIPSEDKQTVIQRTENKDLILSKIEKQMLQPYILEMENIEIFEISSLSKIWKEIDTMDNEQIKRWKKEVIKAADMFDDKKFKKLLDICKE